MQQLDCGEAENQSAVQTARFHIWCNSKLEGEVRWFSRWWQQTSPKNESEMRRKAARKEQRKRKEKGRWVKGKKKGMAEKEGIWAEEGRKRRGKKRWEIKAGIKWQWGGWGAEKMGEGSGNITEAHKQLGVHETCEHAQPASHQARSSPV